MEGAAGREGAPGAGPAGVPGPGGTGAAGPAHSLQAIARWMTEIVRVGKNEGLRRVPEGQTLPPATEPTFMWRPRGPPHTTQPSVQGEVMEAAHNPGAGGQGGPVRQNVSPGCRQQFHR